MWFYKPCFLYNFEGVKLSLTLNVYRVLGYPPGKTLRFCLLHLPSLSSPHTSTHFTDKTVAKEKAATGWWEVIPHFYHRHYWDWWTSRQRIRSCTMTHLTSLVAQWCYLLTHSRDYSACFCRISEWIWSNLCYLWLCLLNSTLLLCKGWTLGFQKAEVFLLFLHRSSFGGFVFQVCTYANPTYTIWNVLT